MPVTVTRLNTFLRLFREAASRDIRLDGPAFTLVLGAGASRSTGVPLTSEMVQVLRTIAKLANIELRSKPLRESEWSWLFRTVLLAVPWENEFSNYEREFIMSCICRARREPNLTHLLAAHLSTMGIFGDIITTNFDDLAVAAFWNLPWASSYAEPHVIYDPMHLPPGGHRIAPGVPVIIKAHGHHTTYGLGIVDKEVRRLSPSVKSLLQDLPSPECGYMVVGYSGSWDDGIMRFFCDPKRARGRCIYWFFRGSRPPEGELLRGVAHIADLRFVPVGDSDALFLRMWQIVHSDEAWFNPPLLEPYHVVSSPVGVWGRRQPNRMSPAEWWPTPEVSAEGTPRMLARLRALQTHLVPLLRRIDQWDDFCITYDCAPASLRKAARTAGFPHDSGIGPPEIEELRKAVPLNIPWTRRNRKILSLALGHRGDPTMTSILLYALREFSEQQ